MLSARVYASIRRLIERATRWDIWNPLRVGLKAIRRSICVVLGCRRLRQTFFFDGLLGLANKPIAVHFLKSLTLWCYDPWLRRVADPLHDLVSKQHGERNYYNHQQNIFYKSWTAFLFALFRVAAIHKSRTRQSKI